MATEDGDAPMANNNDNEFEDEDDEWEEEEEEGGGGGDKEEVIPDENIEVDENDMNAEDFENMDDEFGDDGDFDDDNDDDFGDGDGDWSDDDPTDNNTENQIKSDVLSTLLTEENTAKKPVPQETKKAINDNIDEINMLPMFCGVPDLTAPAVMIGIKIKQFRGISRDQLAVWGLSEYQYIGVRLKFGRWYLHEIEPPSIEIGATNHVSDVGIELEPFRIAWTLQDRCKNAFFCATDWHQNIKMNQIPDTSAINDLMETTQKTYKQCLDALKMNKNDITKTTEYLFNLNQDEEDNNNNDNNKRKKRKKKKEKDDDGIDIKGAKKRFLRVLKEVTSKVDPMSNNNATEKQKKKNWLKQAEKTTKTQKIKQLAEVFNIQYEVAKLAVDALGYDLAAETLTDEVQKMQYVSQWEEMQEPQQNIYGQKTKNIKERKGGKGGKYNKNKKEDSSKKSWWSFSNNSWNNQNEGKYDDDDDDYDYNQNGIYKLEYKVWSNLKKACHLIPNYERMDVWIDDDDDFKKEYGKRKDSVDQSKVMEIVGLGMGFTMNQIKNALIKTNNGTTDIVVDYILNNPNESGGVPSAASNDYNNNNNNNNNNDGISGIDNNNNNNDANDDNVDDNTYKRQLAKKKQAKERKKRMFALGPCPRLTKTSSDSQIHKITKINETMEAISQMFEHNFFMIIINYILKQLLNSTQNCMICGEGLQYPGLKPTICLSPFCQFRLLEIGLGGGSDGGYGLGAEILGGSEICDFLICCACAAAGNPQRSTIFFPEAVRGASSDTADESFLKGDGTPDVEKLKSVIALCPAIDSMKDWARQGEWSLKEELGKLHCLLYPYLIWVITSNRALIMKLPPTQSIKEIKTPHQFIMRSQTPERAEQFNTKKASKGSVFYAWHGSGIFNWHSILRMGLKNYSNTKYMSAGAAYGAGIYTAEQSSTSLGYCTRGAGGMTWKGSKFGQNVCCMALCEIVGPKKDWDKGNGIYVISDEQCVATRYFFLFDSSQGMGGLSANSLTLPQFN